MRVLEWFRHVIVRPFVTTWLAASASSWRSLPLPGGPTVTTAPGDDPDRILLVGSGIAVGYGASSQDDALAGQLAREISDVTGRGSQVEAITAVDMSLSDIREVLTTKLLRSVDAVVVTPGGAEMFLLSPWAWRRQVGSLLDWVAAHAPASLHVFMIALPVRAAVVPPLVGLLTGFTARQLNRQMERVCAAHPNATFVSCTATGEIIRDESPHDTYRCWARLIAPHVGAALDPHNPAERP